MNKQDLAKLLAENNMNMSERKSLAFINSVCDIIEDYLVNGYNVKIKNVGQFVRRETKARIVRNPKTLVNYLLPSRTKIKFVASKNIEKILTRDVVDVVD